VALRPPHERPDRSRRLWRSVAAQVPFKYGYKSPKAIVRLVFAEEELRGYWPMVGPYTTTGEIQPGSDYPLDLGERRQISGGEVIYPDGIESKGE
jgi:hypothetical protein